MSETQTQTRAAVSSSSVRSIRTPRMEPTATSTASSSRPVTGPLISTSATGVVPGGGHQVRAEEERRPGGQAAEGADDAVEPHAGVEAGHPGPDEPDQRDVEQRVADQRDRTATGGEPLPSARRTAPAGRCRGRQRQGDAEGGPGDPLGADPDGRAAAGDGRGAGRAGCRGRRRRAGPSPAPPDAGRRPSRRAVTASDGEDGEPAGRRRGVACGRCVLVHLVVIGCPGARPHLGGPIGPRRVSRAGLPVRIGVLPVAVGWPGDRAVPASSAVLIRHLRTARRPLLCEGFFIVRHRSAPQHMTREHAR